MTPTQKIKHAIVLADFNSRVGYGEAPEPLPEITADNIDEVFDERGAEWQLQDSTDEFRQGEVETGLPCEWSRNYESKAVAAKMPDGSWVGWTYWYGGGKHGEPEAIDWMEDAYALDVVEEEKVVTVRTFSRAEAA